ncbi:hypothetical protein ABEW34_31170 [Paenibacillus algorifonticola]|uniref:hypothetical protein n=1 Tax=Paenibacillus algorifonticola TaxID=684063 RepID=UPI003D280FA9
MLNTLLSSGRNSSSPEYYNDICKILKDDLPRSHESLNPYNPVAIFNAAVVVASTYHSSYSVSWILRFLNNMVEKKLVSETEGEKLLDLSIELWTTDMEVCHEIIIKNRNIPSDKMFYFYFQTPNGLIVVKKCILLKFLKK